MFQQQPATVDQRPALQVVVAAMPEADEAEGGGGGEQFVEGAAARTSQRHVDVSVQSGQREPLSYFPPFFSFIIVLR